MRAPKYPDLSKLVAHGSFTMLWIVFAHTSVLSLELGNGDQHAVQSTEQSIPQQFTLGARVFGANLDFPKYFEKHDRLVRKEKFPEIYHTCDKILLFIYEYCSQSYCAHSAHAALVDAEH